jgi:hypothetical protein
MSALRSYPQKVPATSRHSQRLKLVQEEAAKIRDRLNRREISPDQALDELSALKRRDQRFIDRLIDA